MSATRPILKQSKLELRDPRYAHPLAAMPTAKGLLTMNEEEVGELVDLGTLAAVDIRHPGAAKREIRILTASIAAHQAGQAVEWTPERVTALVLAGLKHQKPWVTGIEVKHLLNCGRQHAMNLVTAGQNGLPQAAGTKHRRGPGGSPVVSRNDLAAWIESRVL